jgi:hypothetical protein
MRTASLSACSILQMHIVPPKLMIESQIRRKASTKVLVSKSFHSIKHMWYHYFLSQIETNTKRSNGKGVAERTQSHLIKKNFLQRFHRRWQSLGRITLISQLLLLFASATPAASSSAALLRSSSRQPGPLPTTGVWKFSGLGSMLLSFDRPKPQSE